MRVLAILAVAAFTACAAQQVTPENTEDALRYEPTLEMNVPHPEVTAHAADGTCIRVLHGWRIASTEPEVVLERGDIGRITVANVGDSYEMLMDLWTDHAETQLDEYGDVLTAPDCSNPHGCQVTYVRGESRVHVYQAGGRHIVELSYPTESRSAQFAIADAIRTAAQVGCPAQ